VVGTFATQAGSAAPGGNIRIVILAFGSLDSARQATRPPISLMNVTSVGTAGGTGGTGNRPRGYFGR
jgi:hypothetical protein